MTKDSAHRDTQADPANALSSRDVRVFTEVAESMIAAGLWRGFRRSATGGCDFFDVTQDEAVDPTLSIGRCMGGRYTVMFHRDGSIRFGRNMAEALAHVAYAPLDQRAG